MAYSQQPGHRTIFVVDVEGFGNNARGTNPIQEAVRTALYRVLRRAFEAANISWEDCYQEDRSDGVFILVAPQVSKAPFVETLPQMLINALHQHNSNAPRSEERIRLRMALHAGEIKHDPHGVTGPSIIRAFRLIEAPALKEALARTPGVLALIVSDWFYEEVVQNSSGGNASRYRAVTVKVKETTTQAWICVPDNTGQQDSHQRKDVPIPHQLPARPRLFSGRTREFAELTKASKVDGEFEGITPIMVIGGMGGIGKTCLALHWAHENADRFPDGQLYVNLRGYDPSGTPLTPEGALRGFLDALCDQSEIPEDTDAQAALYRKKVSGKRILILLDNARDAAQAVPLLPSSPSCAVLVTTRREPTDLIVLHGAQALNLDTLSDAEARELLAKWLGSARIESEPDAVTELAGYCGGLPLALGIVAAYAATHADFPLSVVASDLEDASARLDRLDGGDLSSDLRTVLFWSYQALDEDAAEVFRLLGLAPGPDIGERAAAVLTGLPIERVRMVLRRLEDAHLVQQYLPRRYRMHDLVRLYAAECAMVNRSEALAKLKRLISYFIHVTYRGELRLYPDRKKVDIGEPVAEFEIPDFADDRSILKWFDEEHDCLIAAQAAAKKWGWPEFVWQLAWSLHGYLWRRGHLHEQRSTWEAGLAATQELGNLAVEGLAHRLLGQAYARSRLLTEALTHLYRGRELAKETGDTHGEARSYYDLVMVFRQQNNDQLALNHAKEAHRLFEPLGNKVWKAEALDRMGWHQAQLGHYEDAEKSCQDALELFREKQNRQGQAVTLDTLGYIAHHCGEYDQALDYFNESIKLCRDLGATYYEADTREHLGQSLAALGQRAEAREAWQEALRLNRTQGRTADADRVEQQLRALDEDEAAG
jgi:tetratricopeptide (TPR) repeat protein